MHMCVCEMRVERSRQEENRKKTALLQAVEQNKERKAELSLTLQTVQDGGNKKRPVSQEREGEGSLSKQRRTVSPTLT